MRKRRAGTIAIALLIALLAWLSIPVGTSDQGETLTSNGLYVRRMFVEEVPPEAELESLAGIGAELGVRNFFFHHTPASAAGELPPLDLEGCRRTSERLQPAKLWLWVGGRTDGGVDLADEEFRAGFVESAVRQLDESGFDGLHLNFEPLPSGDAGLLALLDRMREALPEGKLLSVAAIAPPTTWRRSAKLCWSWEYCREVAARCDQIMVMSYDTSIPFPRWYQETLKGWVKGLERELAGTDCEVLMGVPCYGEWRAYHHPWAENRAVAEAALFGEIGDGSGVVKGVAYYAEWTME